MGRALRIVWAALLAAVVVQVAAATVATPSPRVPVRFDDRCESWLWRDETKQSWEPWPSTPPSFSRFQPVRTTRMAASPSPSPYSPNSARGAIVILARRKDVPSLVFTLTRLWQFYLRRFPATVLLFHDDLDDATQQFLRAATPAGALLEFHQVSFCLDPVAPLRTPAHVLSSPINYRHMIRFFTAALFAHPVMTSGRFTHVLRLDTDSWLVSDVRADLFETLARRRVHYGFLMLWKDSIELTLGLFALVEQTLEKWGMGPRHVELWNTWTYGGVFYQGDQFWNNFELVSLEFVQSEIYWDLVERVYRQELIYNIRLGDAPIRSLAVAAFLRPDQIMEVVGVGYQHQNQFRCPLDAEETGIVKYSQFRAWLKQSTGVVPPITLPAPESPSPGPLRPLIPPRAPIQVFLPYSPSPSPSRTPVLRASRPSSASSASSASTVADPDGELLPRHLFSAERFATLLQRPSAQVVNETVLRVEDAGFAKYRLSRDSKHARPVTHHRRDRGSEGSAATLSDCALVDDVALLRNKCHRYGNDTVAGVRFCVLVRRDPCVEGDIANPSSPVCDLFRFRSPL